VAVARRATVTTGDVLLISMALDWLVSSRDGEEVAMLTGQARTAVEGLSGRLWGGYKRARAAAGSRPEESSGAHEAPAIGTRCADVGETVGHRMTEFGFAVLGIEVGAASARTVVERHASAEVVDRLVIGLAEDPGSDSAVVRCTVRVRHIGIEDTLRDLLELPPEVEAQPTIEVTLDDLVPQGADRGRRIRDRDGAELPELMNDVRNHVLPWFGALSDSAEVLDRLRAERFPSPHDERRLAVGCALAGDMDGAVRAVRRHIDRLADLPSPARHRVAGFLRRFGERFAVPLAVPEPAHVAPDAVSLHLAGGAGHFMELDPAEVDIVTATVGCALLEDDLEFEMGIGPSKDQARTLLNALAEPS